MFLGKMQRGDCGRELLEEGGRGGGGSGSWHMESASEGDEGKVGGAQHVAASGAGLGGLI